MSKYKRTSLKYHWESLILCNEDRTGEREGKCRFMKVFEENLCSEEQM